MVLWIVAFIISLLLTLGMGVVFAFISMGLLNIANVTTFLLLLILASSVL